MDRLRLRLRWCGLAWVLFRVRRLVVVNRRRRCHGRLGLLELLQASTEVAQQVAKVVVKAVWL